MAFGRSLPTEPKLENSDSALQELSKSQGKRAGILVVKFGGSSLEDGFSVAKAANAIRELSEKGFCIVVVVSALRGVTDSLLKAAQEASAKPSPGLLDEVLSMGERTSARLLAAALSSQGLKPVVVDPDSEQWPVVTDEQHLDANPIYDETLTRVKARILPLLEAGLVPVVCGYLGKSREGRVTTLGRGGSDTTAVLMGSCLEADEVILVKDVGAVFSSDPNEVAEPARITELDVEEAQILSTGGGRFLHPKALRYMRGKVRVRITNMNEIAGAGTVIVGDLPELEARLVEGQVMMVSIVGDGTIHAEGLPLLLKAVRELGGTLLALTLEEKALILYVQGGTSLLRKLHDLVRFGGIGKAITAFGGLALIEVKGRALETSPGMIQRVTQPLARVGINIFGVVTISSSIRIFVNEARASEAEALIKFALGAT